MKKELLSLKSNSKSWNTTFSDLLLLLLTFFALKLSVNGLLNSKEKEDKKFLNKIAYNIREIREEDKKYPYKKGINLISENSNKNSYNYIILKNGCFLEDNSPSFKTEVLIETLSRLNKTTKSSFEIYTSILDKKNQLPFDKSTWSILESRASNIIGQMIDKGINPSVIKVSGDKNKDFCIFVKIKPRNNTFKL